MNCLVALALKRQRLVVASADIAGNQSFFNVLYVALVDPARR